MLVGAAPLLGRWRSWRWQPAWVPRRTTGLSLRATLSHGRREADHA